jgi:hypothetical protein
MSSISPEGPEIYLAMEVQGGDPVKNVLPPRVTDDPDGIGLSYLNAVAAGMRDAQGRPGADVRLHVDMGQDVLRPRSLADNRIKIYPQIPGVVIVDGKPALTQGKAYDLIELLSREPDQPYNTAYIADVLWGEWGNHRITHIRQALQRARNVLGENDPALRRAIVARRGGGYLIRSSMSGEVPIPNVLRVPRDAK